MIRKTKGGYNVKSHRTGKSLGKYKTKKAAEKRLKQLARYRSN